MKRVYLILTLFMASFFFVSLNEVRADEFNYVIPEDEISFVEIDAFKRIRELAIEIANTNDQYFVITHRNRNFNISNIEIHYFDKGNIHTVSGAAYNSFPVFNKIAKSLSIYKYNSSSDQLYYYTSGSYLSLQFQSLINGSPSFSYINYLDTNIEKVLLDSSNYTINLDYKGNIYTVNNGEHYPTLYQLKLLYDSSSGGNDIERNDSLDSFYILVIEKIQIFASNFISNSACLFIIGIIAFIFVFELIRRFLL